MKSLGEIQAKVHSFGDLFQQGSKLIIPAYQREYRWAPQQVKTFVLDAIKAVMLDSGARFYGPATFSGEPDSSERHIVDGQQRTTTAILLLAALRDQLTVAGSHAETLDLINRCLRTRTETGEVLHKRLTSQHPAANAVLDAIVNGNPVGPEGEKAPGLNYVTAFTAVKEVLSVRVPDADAAAAFAVAFLAQAGVAVTLTSPANAVEIFIKQHETLSPLGLLDKMKGRLFDHVAVAERDDFVTAIHAAQELLWAMDGKTDRNLLHVLRGMSESADRSQPQALVDEAVRMAVSVGVVTYIKDHFLPAVRALDAALRGCHPSGVSCSPLQDLAHVLRLRRFASVRSLYVAARGLTDEQRVELFSALRATLTVLFVARSNPPSNEKSFRAWADGVLSGELEHVLASMKAHRAEHATAFATYYPELGLRNLGQTGVRFLLGLAEDYVRTSMGEDCPAAAGARFPKGKYDVEHILPQDETVWTNFAGAERLVDRLGNLTALECSRNRSIKSKPYATKVEEYKNSDSTLTRSMHSSIRGTGTNSKAVQGADLLEQFPVWDPEALATRSHMLYRLLADALDVPQVTIQMTSQVGSAPVPTQLPNLPQARPDNTLKVLLLIGKGVTEEVDVAARIAGRDDTGADTRQAVYCIEALTFMGLAESDEGSFSLTDPGRELFDAILGQTLTEQERALRDAYAEAIKALPGGGDLLSAATQNLPEAVMAAAKAMCPQLKESTLQHRCTALRTWFADPAAKAQNPQ